MSVPHDDSALRELEKLLSLARPYMEKGAGDDWQEFIATVQRAGIAQERERQVAAREARIDELDNLPRYNNPKYGVTNKIQVSKEWLRNRKAELRGKSRLVGITMPDGQVVRLHSNETIELQHPDPKEKTPPHVHDRFCVNYGKCSE